jgi:hypothetical protein
VRTRDVLLGLKWLGSKADHSPPFSAKDKNECNCAFNKSRINAARKVVETVKEE